MVDLGGNSSARLDGHVPQRPGPDGRRYGVQGLEAHGRLGTEGVNIGEGYWFKVDVHAALTAVPALPLIGQLLLALFLMAGGARLYRRRQG